MTDTRIIEQEQALAYIKHCLTGQQSAYTDLYQLLATGVYRLCYGIVLNEQDAEDVVQETFVYAFKNLSRYDATKSAFKTWLYTIAVSRCRNTYRRKQLQQIDISKLFNLEIAAPSSEHPEALVAHRVAEEALVNALAEIPVTLREAIILRYGHGLTYREIANVMGCPSKTAESRVRLAHDHLRKILQQEEGQMLLEELVSF